MTDRDATAILVRVRLPADFFHVGPGRIEIEIEMKVDVDVVAPGQLKNPGNLPMRIAYSVSDAATGLLHFALGCKLHNGFPSDDGIAAGVPLAEQGRW